MVSEGWDNSPLATLLDRIIDYRGQSVPKATKGVPLITARNVRKGFLDFSTAEFVDESSFENWMNRGIPKKGDILFTTEAPLGNACRFPENGKYAVGQRTVTLRCNSQLDSEFLLYSILSERGQRLIDLRSSGSTAKDIKSSELKKVKFSYPKSLPEQRKIAKILQTWDRAVATTEKLIEASKQQKKALMQQLLTGKKRFAGFEGEWEVLSLGEICKVSGGKRLPRGESLQETPNDHPYIRVTDMNMGAINESHLRYVPDHVAPFIKRYKVKSEDLYISVAGTLGLVGKIPPSLHGANLTENADMLTDIQCDKEYLLYAMMAPSFQNEIENATTQNAQPKLALSRIRSFKISLPCSEEQQKIANNLEASDKSIDGHEKNLAHLKQEKKALMQQLLTGKRRVKVDE